MRYTFVSLKQLQLTIDQDSQLLNDLVSTVRSPTLSRSAKLAEIVGQYLKKGSAVYVEGRIRTRKWTDKEGQERYTTEIEANEMQMLGGRSGGGSSSGGEAEYGGSMPSSSAPSGGGARSAPAKKAPDFNDMDDDIPF